MDNLPRTVDHFCEEVRGLAGAGRLSDALALVMNLVRYTNARESSLARVFTSRDLDRLCLELGRQAKPVAGDFDPDRTVFLATFLSKSGGHTRVVKDLISADPGTKITVV